MCKDFPAGLYSVLFFSLLCISGCYVPGGGSVRYRPPKEIVCDQPWVITIGYSVIPADPKEKYGKLTGRYKDVTIRIRDSLNGNFLAVPMVIESVNPKIGEICYKADMKPIPCDSDIQYVEYYIDGMFGSSYNRTKLYRVPVSKD